MAQNQEHIMNIRFVMRLLIFLLVLGLGAAWALDADDDTIPGPIPGVVIRIIDGDTVRVRARIWLGQEVETNVRLAGIDTAETHAHCDYERAMAAQAGDYVARMLGDGQGIALMDVNYDKYGRRVVARILTPNGQDLSSLLLKTGLAHSYDGGHKQGWCGEK